MRIVSINDVQCNGKTPSEVTRLIKDREGRITISVDDEIQQANPEVIAEAYYPYSVPATAIDTNVDSEAMVNLLHVFLLPLSTLTWIRKRMVNLLHMFL